MQYWLLKSEPKEFSWDDLVRTKQAHWDGVRNFQARNFMKQMKKGDLALMYHSVEQKAVVGIMRITKEHYPDPTDDTTRFVWVDVEPVQALPNPVSLATIKNTLLLKNIGLIRQSRLSVMSLKAEEWQQILMLANK